MTKIKDVFSLEELKEEMEKEGIETIADISGAGILPTSNFGGIAIIPNSTGEVIFAQKVWSGGKSEIEEAEIFYSTTGEGKFRYNGITYSLSEFIRNNYGRMVK